MADFKSAWIAAIVVPIAVVLGGCICVLAWVLNRNTIASQKVLSLVEIRAKPNVSTATAQQKK